MPDFFKPGELGRQLANLCIQLFERVFVLCFLKSRVFALVFKNIR